jgi:hypothetical protein
MYRGNYKCVPDKHTYNTEGRLLTNAAPLLAGGLVELGLGTANLF